MNRMWMRPAWALMGLATWAGGEVAAQSLDTPMTRLRPIGSPSAVDQYRPVATLEPYRETAYQHPSRLVANSVSSPTVVAIPSVGDRAANTATHSVVRHTVMHQQITAPPLPGSQTGGSLPLPTSGIALPVPVAPPTAPINSMPPRGLPGHPGGYQPAPIVPSGTLGSGDAAVIAPPELGSEFATIGNCNCVSGPSSYTAASGIGCGAPVSYNAPASYAAPAYVPPPAQIAAPVVLPTVAAPLPPTRVGPVRPLVTFGQQANTVQVGQGIVGQPVAYVPGQRFRNWVRYFFP